MRGSRTVEQRTLLLLNTPPPLAGGGSNDVDRSVSVTITAMVVEVLDNGNLALEGKRDIAVNREKYTLTTHRHRQAYRYRDGQHYHIK